MAASGDQTVARKEATETLRRIARAAGILDLSALELSTAQGAKFERFYAEKLNDFLRTPARADLGITVDAINTYLRTNPEAARRFTRPWSADMGITVEQAKAQGVYVEGPGEQALVRTFMGIDESGNIYQTLPNGHRITPLGKLGTIYDGLNGPNSFALLAREAAAHQVEQTLGKPGLIRSLAGLDSILTNEQRAQIKTESGLSEDIDTPEGQIELYRNLSGLPDDQQRSILERALRAASPDNIPEKTLSAGPPDEKEAAKAARQKKLDQENEQIRKTNHENATRNREKLEQYLEALQVLKDKDYTTLSSVIDLVDMQRLSSILLSGFVRNGLSLGTGLTYERPWAAKVNIDHGRLWDTVGFGEIYDLLSKQGTGFEIETAGLIEKCDDPRFKAILEQINLSDKVNAQELHKISTVLYAYRVLQHEGMLTESAQKRLANMYTLEGQGLSDKERLVINNAMSGIANSDLPPLVINSKWDLPLVNFVRGQTDPSLSAEHTKWLNTSLATPFTLPGIGEISTTLTPQQGSEYFWLFFADRHLDFPFEKTVRPVGTETIARLQEFMASDPAFKDLPERERAITPGTLYRQLTPAQTLAYFEMEGKGDIAQRHMLTTFQKVTQSLYWNLNGKDTEHALLFKNSQSRQILDAGAEGKLPPPARRAEADFKTNADDIGGERKLAELSPDAVVAPALPRLAG